MKLKLRPHQEKAVKESADKWYLWFEMRCVSGDTIIKYNRAGITRTKKISYLYDAIKNNRSGQINYNIKTKIQSNIDGIVRLNEMVDIFYSGRKVVHEITLENNYSVKTTNDHKILTYSGWKKLSNIKKNNLIATNDDGGYKPRKKLFYLKDNRIKYHPHCSVFNKKYKYKGVVRRTYKEYSLPRHILVYEAKMNNIDYNYFLNELRDNPVSGEKYKFIERSKYCVHHIDCNSYNNDINNLQLLTKKEHQKIHKLYRNFPNTKITYKKIKSIKRIGIEDVYDLECKSPHNNFIANGIVLHNCGKTPTAITLASNRTKTALVISPKSVVSHWEDEIKRWGNGDCDIKVISRETFRRDWAKLDPVEAIIIDEVHIHFSNYKNLAFKALLKYIKKHNCKCIWGLTGTPMPSSSWSVYSYGKIIGKGWMWKDWDKEFFYRINMGNRMIPTPKPNTEKRLQGILKSIGTVVSLKDVADVADDENIIETFSLNREQKKLIKEHFDPMPIIRYTRQHQLESGTMKSDGYRDTISFPCEKDKRLLEIVKDNNKIIIVVRYIDQIDKYVDLLSKLGRNIYKVPGQEKLSASEIAPKAENDPSAIVIIQSDTCLGYSLKSFNTMVFCSMSFSFVNYDQMKSRMKAMEKKTPNTYIHFLTEGESIDRAVYDCVQKKSNFNIELYNK